MGRTKKRLQGNTIPSPLGGEGEGYVGAQTSGRLMQLLRCASNIKTTTPSCQT